MHIKLFVGNLSWNVDDVQLEQIFSEYGEVTSTSNCTEFQSRRLNIRSKAAGAKGTRYAHTLNGTAVAVTRAIIAILENYQQADGSVIIPEVLRPFVGKDRIVAKG